MIRLRVVGDQRSLRPIRAADRDGLEGSQNSPSLFISAVATRHFGVNDGIPERDMGRSSVLRQETPHADRLTSTYQPT